MSAIESLSSKSRSVSSRMDLHTAPLDLNPHRALITIINFSFSFPNSVPDFAQILSLYFVFMYVFPISHAQISISLIAERLKAIRTLYL